MLLRAPAPAAAPHRHISSSGGESRRRIYSPPSIRCCSTPRLSESSYQSVISKVHSYNTVDFEDRSRRRLGRRRRNSESTPSIWSPLYRQIATTECEAAEVLEKWEAEERQLTKWELVRIAKELRKFRRFNLALQVYEWMTVQGDRFITTSSDLAIQLDLIAKVRGVDFAEELFSRIPDTLMDKRTYGAMLNVYGQAKLKSKAEAIFDKMLNGGFARDALAFNVMMTLYMNIGEHDRVVEIIDEMKENNVMPDIYTYNIWITNAAAMEDAEEMERIFKLMTSEGNISANWTTYTTLATMYVKLGDFEKAQSYLKDAETRITGRDRAAFQYLIGLYSSIGKKEEVYRIWNWYKTSFPSVLNIGYQTMLASLVKLGDINGAEMIFEEWFSRAKSFDAKVCNILLGWYAREGLVMKAKHAVEQLIEKGGKPKPSTWEFLAEGYIKVNQVQEALSCLEKAAYDQHASYWRPKPENISNLLVLLRGQHNTEGVEKIMEILKSRKCHERAEYESFFNPDVLSSQ